MSQNILIIGESGSGKTASLRNLNPETSFLISTLRKPLPFKGWKEKFKEFGKDSPNGNWLMSDNSGTIRDALKGISDKRPKILDVVIDDFQYLMANEYMRRASEKGWEKFSQIGENAWNVIFDSGMLRDDLIVTFLSHSETTETGITKIKTIGKMLDEKITLEGMFTTVLRALLRDGKHVFSTRNSGMDVVKAPMGMFSEDYVDNNLAAVLATVRGYK